ncbi:MAG: hypothetical protein ABIZ56_07500 [Chthoniobacteraceae bacterium]
MKTRPRFLAATLLLMSPALHATIFTWDGGTGFSEEWTVAGNWLADVAPPSDGTADIVFSGTDGLSPNANLDWNIRSIAFAGGAASFGVHGNVLTVGAGGITNGDDSVQTIENDIILSAAQTFSTASTGSMAVNGSINTNGRVLTIAAATDFITLGGAITGSGGLAVSGSNSLVLTGGASNTYTGGTTINGPVVLAKTGGALAIPGAIIIGNGAATASLAIGFDEQIGNSSSITVSAGSGVSLGNGVTETIGALALAGTAQVNNGTLNVGTISMFGGTITTGSVGKVVLSGEITAVSAGLQRSVISGNLNLGGSTRTITVVDGLASTELEIQASVSNGSLVKEGAGGLLLKGPQNYASLLVHAGTTDLETPLGTGSASVSVSPVTGEATVNFLASQYLSALTIESGGIVTLTDLTGSSDFDGTGAHPMDIGEFTALPIAQGIAVQNVPEPTAGVLVITSLAAVFAGRRRK